MAAFSIIKISDKIPKSIIYFFMAILTFFGIDAGFSKVVTGKTRTFLRLYSICLTVLIVGVHMSKIWSKVDTIWFWTCAFKLIFYALASQLTKYTIYDFVQVFHDNNENNLLLEKGYCGFGMSLYVFSTFMGKLFFTVVRCRLEKERYCPNLSEILHFICIYALDCSDIVGSFLIVITFYVYAYAVDMRKKILSSFDLRSFEKRFIFLYDNSERIKIIYNIITIVELFTNTPRIMVTLWYMLKFIKDNAEWYNYVSQWLFAFHLIIQMCIPAVLAEMAKAQVEAIKLILIEQRRVEEDPAKLSEVTRVLRYVKGRRLQCEIASVIPLDLRLPLALLSVCSTYFIVILQFTHLYD